MSQRTILIIIGLAVLGGAWYAFRPERLFIQTTVNESFPVASAAATRTGPTTLLRGSFHGVAHMTSGTATIYEVEGSKRVLRFTNFETSNGPDVQVYLVAANDAGDNDTVKKAGFIHLGALKGTTGDQNYELPAEADLSKHRAVTVWCRRFGVNFGTAPLVPAGQAVREPVPVASGEFHGVAHKTTGTATVYQLADGKRLLRFMGFETSNGPDVQVYMVAADDAKDNDTVKKAGFVHLAALKGTSGDQNYELPAELDLNKYKAVTIWCRRFGVNFATAPLSNRKG
jgi:hypothetical protein